MSIHVMQGERAGSCRWRVCAEVFRRYWLAVRIRVTFQVDADGLERDGDGEIGAEAFIQVKPFIPGPTAKSPR